MLSLKTLPSKLYHGTTYNNLHVKDIEQIDPNYKKANNLVDFGPGFYTTGFLNQAEKHALERMNLYNRKASFRNLNPTAGLVVEYNFDIEKFKKLDVKHLEFLSADEEWTRFILNNRLDDFKQIKGIHNKDCIFDTVYGPLADGRIGLEVEYYKEEIDKAVAFRDFKQNISQNFSFDKYDQLSFHNKEIIHQCLTYSKHWIKR